MLPSALRYGEAASLTFDADQARVSEILNVEMLFVMNVHRKNGWPRAAVTMIGSAAAQHTVMLREHETELGNASAEAGGLFDEEDFEPGVR